MRGRPFLLAIFLAAPLSSLAQNWQRVQGVDSTHGIYALAAHEGAFYAVSDTLMYRSVDGLAWQQTASQPPAQYGGYALFSHASGLYLGTVLDGASRTTDGGQSWHRPATGLSAGPVFGFAVLGDTVFAGTGDAGIHGFNWKSPGAWFNFSTGLTQVGANALIATSDRLIASLGSYLFVRPRGAAQWSQIDVDGPASQLQIFDLLAVGSSVYVGSEEGVFRSSLNALSWQPADIAPMARKDIYALAAQGSRLFAGLNFQGQHWIWSTDNEGASWDVRAHEYAEIWDLLIVGNRMWAARQDGLWYYDLSPVGVKNGVPAASAGLSLRAASLGPTGAETRLWITAPSKGRARLEIIDLGGRVARALSVDFEAAGAREVSGFSQGLAAGAYGVRAAMNGGWAAMKIVIQE